MIKNPKGGESLSFLFFDVPRETMESVNQENVPRETMESVNQENVPHETMESVNQEMFHVKQWRALIKKCST